MLNDYPSHINLNLDDVRGDENGLDDDMDHAVSVESDWDKELSSPENSQIEEIKISQQFIECLKIALHKELDPEILKQIQLPDDA